MILQDYSVHDNCLFIFSRQFEFSKPSGESKLTFFEVYLKFIPTQNYEIVLIQSKL